MLISKVVIDMFRSVKSAEFSPTAFNVFVGQNNHGKTNIFEAISWFYEGGGSSTDNCYGRKGEAFSVEVEFSGVQAGLDLMKNEKNKASLKKLLGDADTMRIIRRSAEPKKRQIWHNNEWTTPPTGFDAALTDALPRLEYVRTTTSLAAISEYKKTTPIGIMLSGVLTAILEKSEPYQQFRQQFDKLFGDDGSDVKATLDTLSGKVKLHLEQQFPDCTKVSFDISQPAFDDLLKGFDTSIDDGIITPADQKGDGMQRALMLAIIKTYADHRKNSEDQGKNFIFLLDEAEVHLHPSAQRQLKEVLLSISQQGDQVFINTHSSVLIADADVDQSIYKVAKAAGATSVGPVVDSDKPAVVYELLGGSPSDLLLPRNIVIVEGHSDHIFLTNVIKRFYSDRTPLLIIAAGGDIDKQEKSMAAINAAFLPLHLSPLYRNRLVILCDKPNAAREADYAAFLAKFPYLTAQGQVHLLPECSIEECYPKPWKRTPVEVQNMKAADKKSLAVECGTGIALDEFEKNMSHLKSALDRAWAEAYV